MRRIDKIIIHCSGTKAEHDIDASDIRQWHKAKGWSDIGYHYFIKLNGTVETGRYIEKVGAHAFGYNKRSIGICYAGGVAENGIPKDTRTEDQKKAMRILINLLKIDYPKATVHGHNEFSSKACPSFDVKTQLCG